MAQLCSHEKILSTLAALALVVSLHSTVRASEDPDSNKYHITSIKWIIATQDNLDNDDRYVVLVGKVTSKIDGDSYIFNDGTGSILLDSDIDLPVGKPIVIRGYIDQDLFGNSVTGNDLEVDVKSWRKN